MKFRVFRSLFEVVAAALQHQRSTGNYNEMIWVPVNWATASGVPWPCQYAGYIGGVRCAMVTWERGRGWLTFARARYVWTYENLAEAEKEAMFSAVEIPQAVCDFVEAMVEDYGPFYEEHEPIAAAWCGAIASLVAWASEEFAILEAERAQERERIAKERAEMIRRSQEQIDAFNARFSSKGRKAAAS